MTHPRPFRRLVVGVLGAWLASAAAVGQAADIPRGWEQSFPKTDFSQRAIDLSSIQSGGLPRDAIPSIDDPKFVSVQERQDCVDTRSDGASNKRECLADTEPVIGLEIDGDARAYPLRILTWHEIVNDRVGGTPVAVTYCPLCNSAMVFDATVDGRRLTFGTTGKLRNSDLVMYDRQTESWWQQFTGKGIVGTYSGTKLDLLPSRLESWESFRARHPEGKVLVPSSPLGRPYGENPYAGYDSRDEPMMYRGPLPETMPAMGRVVVVGETAWDLRLLRETKRIETDELVITWTAGQTSALDARDITKGRDVGNVVVQRKTAAGLEDIPYEVTFAFVFKAFHPEGTWHVKPDA
jgi:hypothetical protein